MSEGRNGSNQVSGLDINVVSANNTSKVETEEILKLTSKLSTNFKDVFDENVGSCIKGSQVELKLKEDAKPTFHRAYDMPFALKERVEHELLKMVQSGILRKVSFRNWASPIVVVPKKNSEIRICMDFKKTLNQVLNTDHCVLPLPEEIYSSLSGQRFFTVIDLKGAYQQLRVGEKSQELLVINTHLGLFGFTRLTYGVSSAPGIFQSVMDTILSGQKNTKCYLDDILVYGSSLKECYENVKNVFRKLQEFNVKINVSKCKFFKKEVEFLGHNIDNKGIHPTEDKIKAIKEAPSPKSLTELKSYLGLISYYRKFIPMLSSRLKPLYDLCQNSIHFSESWSNECEHVFQTSKEWLTSDSVLTHYDPKQTIYVTCDASSRGVGCVLSHSIDNTEKPVLFASSSLSKAEQNYSHLDREALAIIFALKKFHKYLYGRRFVLVTTNPYNLFLVKIKVFRHQLLQELLDGQLCYLDINMIQCIRKVC